MIGHGACPAPTRLRVGVIVDGIVVPAFQASVLRHLASASQFEVVHLGIDGAAAHRPDRGQRLLGLIRRLDRRLLGHGSDALAPVSVRLVPGSRLPRIGIDKVGLAGGAAASGAVEPDVVLDLRRGPRRSISTDAARLGVWRIHIDAGREGSSIADAVRERSAITRVSLVAWLPDRDAPAVLDRSYSPVARHSFDRTVQAALWTASRIVRRAFDRVSSDESGRESDAFSDDAPLDPESGNWDDSPGLVASLGLVAAMAGELANRAAGRLAYSRSWFVAYRWSSRGDPQPRSLAGFSPIAAPTGRFFADPFVVEIDGCHHVFVEDYDEALGRARISTFVIGADGSASPPVAALERPYHLSYPFVFTLGDQVYLLPETRGAGRVELYRSVRFPDQWALESVLLDNISAADPTLLRHDGRLWLFVTVAEPGDDAWADLHLYSADSLVGPWAPHPWNPVVSDVRFARPAGRPFLRDGRILRPAQDCSRAYGWRIALRRIDALSPTAYAETTVGHIEPRGLPGVQRTHSYDAAGNLQVLDGYRATPRIRYLRRRL
jgi:hypothetical protein